MGKHKAEEVEEEEVAPFWMISFSDLMTLLLSFFVILFSMSTIETKKMQEVMEAMGDRYLRGSSAHSGTKVIRADPTQPKAKQPTVGLGDQPAVATPDSEPETTPEASRQVVSSPPAMPALKPTKRPEIDHTIIPFRLGNAALDDEDKKKLTRLAEQLLEMSDPITIRGHASNNEHSSRDVDDLAYERAWNVREHLLACGLERKRFTLVVAGPNGPLDRNSVMLTSRFGDVNTYVDVFLKNE